MSKSRHDEQPSTTEENCFCVHLVQQNAVREFSVGRDDGRLRWLFSVRIGVPTGRLLVALLKGTAGFTPSTSDIC